LKCNTLHPICAKVRQVRRVIRFAARSRLLPAFSGAGTFEPCERMTWHVWAGFARHSYIERI
jgi:hypothetical protein